MSLAPTNFSVFIETCQIHTTILESKRTTLGWLKSFSGICCWLICISEIIVELEFFLVCSQLTIENVPPECFSVHVSRRKLFVLRVVRMVCFEGGV